LIATRFRPLIERIPTGRVVDVCVRRRGAGAGKCPLPGAEARPAILVHELGGAAQHRELDLPIRGASVESDTIFPGLMDLDPCCWCVHTIGDGSVGACDVQAHATSDQPNHFV
jgi:hypothetical protein